MTRGKTLFLLSMLVPLFLVITHAGAKEEGQESSTSKTFWGFVHKTGKLVIPAICEQVYGFREGMAVVKTGGKWGFIDKTGRMITEPMCLDADFFHEGGSFPRVKLKYSHGNGNNSLQLAGSAVHYDGLFPLGPVALETQQDKLTGRFFFVKPTRFTSTKSGNQDYVQLLCFESSKMYHSLPRSLRWGLQRHEQDI
jgi:hypothetical protein